MSLALLLEKYDVSTEEGLQKALGDIEKEESEVNEALSGALSRACNLEGRMKIASQAYSKLGGMKADAQTAADMVDRTAALATHVSAKVRQLDLARSRVAECQRRVHDLIDLQLCSAGVEAAIKAHDYETGAAHVARFLSMDPGSVAAARARGAPDPRANMTQAANTLREHLVRKFEEAARKEDEASVERLFKLFPQIGRAEEGMDLLARYLATQAEAAIRRACIVPNATSEEAVFADALTRVLEAGGAALQRARAAAAAAPGLLYRAVRVIQPKVCFGARRVYTELVAARRLEAGPAARSSPLAAEPALAELALAHSRLRLYVGFLRRNAEADASTLKEEEKKAALEAIEKIIAECDLTRTAQEILGHYLALERYFLEESVNKALKMSAPQAGATSSRLVDDVFFIARKVIRRALSTGSVDGACAVLNEAAALLERAVAGALRRRLRAPPPEPLPLPPPAPPPALDGGSLALRLNRDVDAQRLLFIAHMNEAEAGAEWSERLAAEACLEAEPLLRGGGASQRGKLQSCASGLGAAAAAFRAAHDLACAGVLAALKPRIVAWAEMIAEPPEDDDDELEDDADLLPAALEVFNDSARAQLSARAAEDLLPAVVGDIASRAQDRLLHHHYNRESGAIVERRARRLASWAGSAGSGGRERCARLTQAAALLALEALPHAHDALRPAARLAPPAVRDILRRRYATSGARLTQAAALLALEALSHAHDALRPAARLAPPAVRDILRRRYATSGARLTQAAALLALEALPHAHDALRPAARLAPPAVRDILRRRYATSGARLTQAAALLALEALPHAHDALRPAARLAPPAVRDILRRRYATSGARLTQAAALLALEALPHAHDALRPAARLAPPAVRDILRRRYATSGARLTQAAALLALEALPHAHDALRPAARLAPPAVRDILRRRYATSGARLTQAAALLALEALPHAHDALRPAARLAPPAVRDILRRRYATSGARLTQAAALLALEALPHAHDALRPAARLAPPAVRDILRRRYATSGARLTQAAALLALEALSHAHDALRPAARLAPPAVRDILRRRYATSGARLTQAAALLALEALPHAHDALRPAARLAPPAVRDILRRRYATSGARLTQAAALLALEALPHAHDALRPAARLAPPAVRDILRRRTDFKMEEIKRLKL